MFGVHHDFLRISQLNSKVRVFPSGIEVAGKVLACDVHCEGSPNDVCRTFHVWPAEFSLPKLGLLRRPVSTSLRPIGKGHLCHDASIRYVQE